MKFMMENYHTNKYRKKLDKMSPDQRVKFNKSSKEKSVKSLKRKLEKE